MNGVVLSGALILIVMGIALVIYLFAVVGRFDRLIIKLTEELPPLVDKADKVVDGMQEQLSRVESVVESAHNVSAKVHATAQGAQQIIGSPIGAVIALLSGLGRSWRSRT